MVEYREGDLFKSGAQTLVNATNVQGVMGAGIAKAFKEKFPTLFEDYRFACDLELHTATVPHFWRNKAGYASAQTGKWVPMDGPHVLNIASTPKIGGPVSLTNLALNMVWIIENYKACGITSLAVPALGCGIGGATWDDVSAILRNFLGLLDIPVYIYKPQ